MRKVKRLKKSDINKNSSIELKHSINKIKEKEGKYTAILVVVFMIIFSVIGYFTLSFNRDNYKDSNNYNLGDLIINSNPSILLTKNNKMEDWLGLSSDVYSIEISNVQSSPVTYQLSFSFEDIEENNCECKNNRFKLGDIKYSLDGENIYTLGNSKGNIMKTGTLEAGETEVIDIRMWIDSFAEVADDLEQHIHGRFNINKMN